MIRIKRTPIPKRLRAVAEQELREVLEHYEQLGQSSGYRFRAYRVDGVAEALNKLFNGKCAYCESPYSVCHPTDIEHYRPKGEVSINGQASSPGYYWLAARWDNLLPSCIFCNRPNRTAVESGQLEVLGKGIQFPLVDEAKRARRSTDSLSAETPLILNPCGKIDPRKHLQFLATGKVVPRLKGRKSRLAANSIKVLALQRPSLVKARREHAMRIKAQIDLVYDCAYRMEKDPSVEDLLIAQLDFLADYLKPNQNYIALTMDLIEKEAPDYLPILCNIAVSRH